MNRMKIKHTKSTAYFKACYSYYKNVVHYIFTQSGQNEHRKINNNLKNFWKIYFSTSKPISVEILFGFFSFPLHFNASNLKLNANNAL